MLFVVVEGLGILGTLLFIQHDDQRALDAVAQHIEQAVVADEEDRLIGFVCVQLKNSFCYDAYLPEITEVYVRPAHRKKGIARAMITFAETYCSQHYPLHKYELLTGMKNLAAQSVYRKLGYTEDHELHFSKQVKK